MGSGQDDRFAFLDRGKRINSRGKVNLEASPASDLALDSEKSSMALDDSNHRRKPQARAEANLLGGKKWIEDLVDDVARDSHPGVLDLEENIGPGFGSESHTRVVLVDREVCRGKAQGAASRHRIARIDTEVEQDLMELGGVALDRP